MIMISYKRKRKMSYAISQNMTLTKIIIFRPESVVTTGNNMYIIFRSKAKLKTEVFLEIQAGLTKGFDLNVTDSVIDDNSGRGIWVNNSF